MSVTKSDTLSSAPMLRRASKLCHALASWIFVAGVCIVLIIISPQFAQYGAVLLLSAAAFFLEVGMLLCFSLGLSMSRVGEELGVPELRRGVLLAIPTLVSFSAAFALVLLGGFCASLDAVSGYILLLLAICLFATLITTFPISYLFQKGMSEVTRWIGLGELESYHRSMTVGQSLVVGVIATVLIQFVLNSFSPLYNNFVWMVTLLWGILLFVATPATLLLKGLAYGDPDGAILLPEPLPKKDRSAVRKRIAEAPKLTMREFEKIGPDKTFETNRFKIMVKGDTYILIPRFFRFVTLTPLFIRFFRRTATPEKKLVVPYGWSMRKMRFAHRVTGFPVTKVRGTFSIPVDVSASVGGKPKEVYAKGPGIAYVVDGYGGVRPSPLLSVMPTLLDKKTILEIISELSKEENLASY